MTYTFEVETVGALAISPPSAPASATAIDGTITANGSATVAEGGTYTLNLGATFNADEAATISQYVVDWGDGSDDSIVSTEPLIAQHTFADGTDSSDINVQAVTAGTTALPTFTMSLPTVHVDVIPNPPSDVTTTAVSYNEIDLSWTDNSDSAQTYNILRSDDGGVTYNSIGTTDGTETTYQDGSVQPSSSYLYEVEADDSAGLTSGAVGPADGSPDTTPGAPVPDLEVDPDDQNDCADLSWNYSGAASGYELEEEDLSLNQNFYWIALTHTVSLIPGDQYYFRLRADLPDGTASPYSDPQEADVPVDSGVTLSASAFGIYDTNPPDGDGSIEPLPSIQLTLKNSSGAPLANQQFYYRYYATTTAGPGWVDGVVGPHGEPDETGPDGTYYVGLGLGQTGTFEVVLSGSGNGQWSNPATGTEPGPEFAGPSDFTATATADDLIHISWAGDTSDTGFDEYALGSGIVAPGARGTAIDMAAGQYHDYTPGQSTITYTATGLPGVTYDIVLAAAILDQTTDLYTYTWQHTSVTMRGNVVPDAPAVLNATLQTTNTTYKYPQDVFLYWQNSSSNESGFDVERSTTSNFTKHVEEFTTGEDDTQYIDTDLQLTTFYYRVKATKGSASSPWSNIVTVLVHYKIDLQFNAYIPKRLGVPAGGTDYNWIKEPLQLLPSNYHYYAGTDNRNGPGELGAMGTSRIHTVVDIDTDQIGCPTPSYSFTGYADPSHRALAYDVGGSPAINPAQIQSQSADVDSNSWSTDLSDSDLSTRIDVDASGGYPFIALAPDVYIFISWELTIGSGLFVNVKLKGTTTAFPAFEGLANGKVAFQRMPTSTGPGLFNMGPLSPDVPVNGSAALP